MARAAFSVEADASFSVTGMGTDGDGDRDQGGSQLFALMRKLLSGGIWSLEDVRDRLRNTLPDEMHHHSSKFLEEVLEANKPALRRTNGNASRLVDTVDKLVMPIACFVEPSYFDVNVCTCAARARTGGVRPRLIRCKAAPCLCAGGRLTSLPPPLPF